MKKTLGLSSSEAKKLLSKFGPNEIVGKPKHTPFQILISQFTSILVVLLIIATVASFALGERLDGIFILFILVLNATLGFTQEYQAEKAIEALKKMTVSTIRVIRDGQEQEIDGKLLVPGDLIVLEEGDKIPADATVIDSMHLEVNEAALTGESMPVEKNHRNPEKQQIFLGTVVAKGRAKAVVATTGMRTKFGKIAASLSEIEEEETPLTRKLNILGKQLGILAILASIIVFTLGFLAGYPLFEMVLTSISLAVASVPEGLPAVITITLAVGMQRMARQKAILRKLSAVEALGNATVIATDKTGTLTKNEMRVVKIWFDGKKHQVHSRKLEKNLPIFEKLLAVATICNNASLVFKHDSSSWNVLGDTTEGALLLLAADYGWLVEEVKGKGKVVDEFAFDPNLKTMTVIWQTSQTMDGLKPGKYVFSKGAPETILKKSSRVILEGQEKLLGKLEEKMIKQAFQSFARDGLRVIALAYRTITDTKKSRNQVEKNLTFLGFVGIADPPREEVNEAINIAERAGIRTIMVTGDSELTANTIATQIGLIKEDEEVITGKLFEKLSDIEAQARLERIRIFARTTPEHKLRIVRLLQSAGHVVAVTGDGVNDALALKQADIGVAMGVTGTDVAKEAADMIITDDNYATIVKAVEEGRTIFDNIKSSVKYLIGCNIGEVLAVLGGMILGWPLILTPLQILYVNLVTDGLPALALAVKPKRKGIMKKAPHKKKNIFGRFDHFWFAEVSVITALATITAFFLGMQTGNVATARALSFTTVILVQHFIFIDVWVGEMPFWSSLKIYKNIMFLSAFFLPLIVHPFILYSPVLSRIFKVSSVSFNYLTVTISLSATVLIFSEIRKMLFMKKVKLNIGLFK